MPSRVFDIAIIGGGVIGLTLARELGGRDARVAVIDAGAAVPQATVAAAGMLAPSFETCAAFGGLAEPLYHLGARSLAMWQDYAPALEEETGIVIDYRRDGTLGLAYRDAQAEDLAKQAALVKNLGGAAEMISGDEARALEPALSNEVVAALHAPEDAQVDPRHVMSALRISLKNRDIEIVPARVLSLGEGAAAGQFACAEGDVFEAQTIVLAAGAVSGLTPMGLVYPVKGEATAIAAEGVVTRVVRAPGAYICPKAGGRVVIGATEELGPLLDHHSVSDAAIAGLRANAARAAPGLSSAQELERWAGLRPGTPDGAPIMGRDKEGRFLALGHYRNGVLHAPAAAEAMAALILGETPPFDLAPFDPSRFGPGRFSPAQGG
ncbi:NAD(P)/FAD-dependent oxidoreductase [Hyphococcus sp.]|uniref:NAD(P)/FAD-dependent oxidoreductase n=1 Tax=Hyphococcus sp. TaxID=2038636 RepID=UPI0035C6CFA7